VAKVEAQRPSEREPRPPAGGEELGDALREILQELQRNLRGVLGSVIVTDDGSPLVWDLRGVEPMLVATAGALMTQATQRIADLLDMGGMRNIVLTTEQGSVAVFRITEGSALVVLLQPTTNSVLVVIEANKALERLREVMVPGR
jgi:predicted regulator of Ras-like GTPase activity (Roadblock/LC7/MglB family)